MLKKDSVSVRIYRAEQSGDFAALYTDMRHDINIVNRRISEFVRAGEGDAYHVKAIRRIGERLNIMTKKGYLKSLKVDQLAELPKEGVKELARELDSFVNSRVGTLKALLSSDNKRIDTMIKNHPILSKHNVNIDRDKFKDFINNDTIQRALSKRSGISSTQLIEDYMQMIDNDEVTKETFLQRLDDFLSTDDIYATYKDYIEGQYDKS